VVVIGFPVSLAYQNSWPLIRFMYLTYGMEYGLFKINFFNSVLTFRRSTHGSKFHNLFSRNSTFSFTMVMSFRQFLSWPCKDVWVGAQSIARNLNFLTEKGKLCTVIEGSMSKRFLRLPSKSIATVGIVPMPTFDWTS